MDDPRVIPLDRTLIFIDTNIFVHYKPIDKIPFKDLASNSNIDIIITRFNLDELNKIKDSNNSPVKRTRAKQAISLISSLFPEGDRKTSIISDSIHARLLLSNGNPEYYGLSSNIADNILLATILDYSNQGYKTILLTGDQGMRLSAISREISCIDPEIYKLPEEPSAIEVELRKCKLELEKLKNRQPALSFSEKTPVKLFSS